jgi:hypothetical protein
MKLGNDTYEYRPEDEYEEDNHKIFHMIYVNGKPAGFLDLSPYERPIYRTLEISFLFHHKFGRFPNRGDIDSNGPLHQTPIIKGRSAEFDIILDKVLYTPVEAV